MSEIA